MTKPAPTADLILHRGLFTTLARAHPTATAVASLLGKQGWLMGIPKIG
jgi:predicted amidohydrolase YtcJ